MAKTHADVDLSGFGFEKLQHIGKGQYAQAQLVKDVSSGHTYVAKCISLAALNDHDQDLAHQEVFLLQTFNHPYIVGYRDSFLIEGANTLVIVMEYCNAGDLRKAIKEKVKCQEHFAEEQVMTWFVQLCLALQYIHSEKVLHRDLKTSNIFLTNGGSEVKLGDFGISRVLEGTTEAAVTIVGTPYYMSPEVCRNEPYSWKSDIWALGCVLYELCMLKHAFESSSLLGLVYKIVSDHYEPIPQLYSTELNDLIRQLLMKNAEQRPSINEMFCQQYVKAYLAREAVPTQVPPPPPPSGLLPQSVSKRSPTLRPGASRAPPPPPLQQNLAAAPLPAGLPPMGPEMVTGLILARVRRRLVGQKLNWISAFAPFDQGGQGVLSMDSMHSALTSVHLGLSEAEISHLINALAIGGQISLDAFSDRLMNLSPEVRQTEAWARQFLVPAGPKLIRDVLHGKDVEQLGTLVPPLFQDALREVIPSVNPNELESLLMLADKNGLGDIDYCEFIDAFAVPLAPAPMAGAPLPPGGPASPLGGSPLSGSPSRTRYGGFEGMPGGPAAPPGMPPLGVGAPTSAAPPGMPPLSVGAPQAASQAQAMEAFNLTLGGTLGGSRLFYTCSSSNNAPLVAGSPSVVASVSLSPLGCALILSRIKRRLETAGLSIAEATCLFTSPGDRELAAEQWQDVASSLPLGTSRAEMQQLFSKLDSSGSGRLSIEALSAWIGKVNASDCAKVPSYLSAAMQRGLQNRIRDELRAIDGGGETGLAKEADFRFVVTKTEKYLTADQLNSLLLLADKSPGGLVDYEEFAQRFSGSPAVLQASRGLLLGLGTVPAARQISMEEVLAVASRTGAVLDRFRLAPERLPALLALWGGNSLAPGWLALSLASLPLGLSAQEAMDQLQMLGSVEMFASKISQLKAQGDWRGRQDWAACAVPGDSLRNVLRHQVIEAECRALEINDFARLLMSAGVRETDINQVIWLAEKTTQGAVCVAEFLENFAGAELSPSSVDKKKRRGMLSRIIRR